MDWHFQDNESGLKKLHQLEKMLQFVRLQERHEQFDNDVIEQLLNEVKQILQSESGARQETKSLKDYLRDFFGPSKKEIELSKQRQSLIARAEHAEQSAFAALAETADVGKQRDNALAELRELQKTLKSLEKADKSTS